MDKKLFMYDAKPHDREFFDRANGGGEFEIKYFPGRLEPDTAKLAEGYPAVCVFTHDDVGAEVIRCLHERGVGLVTLRCAGYNHVDLEAAHDTLRIVRVPAYSPHAVAEHAAGLLLALNRKLHRAYGRTRDGNFSLEGLMGFDLHGKTAGVIGTGRIGRCLIEILSGFGMDVLAHDVKQDEAYARKAGFRYVGAEELYARADVVSLHMPLTPDTHHFIDRDSVSRMKKGVFLVNTSRGKLIDTEALIEGLKDGTIGAAGLDVYEEEEQYFYEDWSGTPIGDDVLARLLTFPNALVTSHQGFFTREALTSIAETTLANVRRFVEGEPLQNEVHQQGRETSRPKAKAHAS